jgi:hypothetical protein
VSKPRVRKGVAIVELTEVENMHHHNIDTL